MAQQLNSCQAKAVPPQPKYQDGEENRPFSKIDSFVDTNARKSR